MNLKIVAIFLFLLFLVQLVTGRTYSVNSTRWLRVRLSERPGARVYWGPVWVRRTEDPRLYWGSMIGICLMLFVIVLGILHKLPPAEIIFKLMLEGVGGLFCSAIVASFFYMIWKPSRREVFGIGSPRTVGLYVACLLSVPFILILNLRSGFPLGILFFVPFLLMILGRTSARIDSGR
jgi:hypothetical protein